MTKKTDIVAAEALVRWRTDPVSFVVEELKVTPDAWQVDVLRALPHNMRLAMKACKGPGKTALLAWVCWWFMVVHPHPKIAATSITGDNLSDGLWSEMSKWQQKSEFLKEHYQWTKTRIFLKAAPETWFMSARQWAKSATPDAQADTLAGLHADYIMFVLDEAGGIPDSVMAAAEAALSTGIVCKLVMAGNPTHLSGPLYRACTKEAKLWHVTEITGDPDNPKRSPRINIEWARQQIEKYGRDNPWVLVNVFGKFPPSSINALLGPDDVKAAMALNYREEQMAEYATVIGIDVAGLGTDRTVLFPRRGQIAFKPLTLMQQRGEMIAGHAATMSREYKADAIFVDGTGGWGLATCEFLNKLNITNTPIQFSGKAPEQGFANMRTYMAWKLAEAIKTGGLMLPDMPELLAELTALEYTYNGDKIALIDKDLIREKLNGQSPDYTDALMLTYAYPVVKLQTARGEGEDPRHTNPVDDFVRGERERMDGYDPFKDFR